MTLVDPSAGIGRIPSLVHKRTILHKRIAAIAESDQGLDAGSDIGDDMPHMSHIADEYTGPLSAKVKCLRMTLEDALVQDPLLASASALLCAMHPDEATEAVVDAALAAKRPFAVVPCCVCPTYFKDRSLKNGVSVVKYGGFLQYLREKDVRIRATRLMFVGRSTVLFMTLSDYDRVVSGQT
mmetsp:Transcript_87437/g.222715  ORF Transcript_87437/g.222715 Transcript_87437/m.222715 type:complete len:182 (+) Transcript_87437:3-548(+)